MNSEGRTDALMYLGDTVYIVEAKLDASPEDALRQIQEKGYASRFVGSGKEVTIGQLAELVKSTVGYCGELRWDASKPDGTMRKLTDVSKLHSLGWRHRMELEDGVPALYRWYRESMHNS